jgi:hypothetical protein
MDHPCYKCSHSVEDGKAFCAYCGAPQIRVAIAEVQTTPAVAEDRIVQALPFDVRSDAQSVPAALLAGGRFDRLRPCALAAMIAAVPMFFGVSPFLAALGAGFLTIAFLRSGHAGAIGAATGAKLGALSGLLLFALSTILEMLAVALLHKGAEIRSQMMEKIQQAAAHYPGPEVQPFLDFVRTPAGFTAMLVGSLIFGLIAFVVLGSCGGALGASLLGRRDRS